MRGVINVERIMRLEWLFRQQSEKHALWWYDRAFCEHEKQELERIFGEVLLRALEKRKQSKSNA